MKTIFIILHSILGEVEKLLYFHKGKNRNRLIGFSLTSFQKFNRSRDKIQLMWDSIFLHYILMKGHPAKFRTQMDFDENPELSFKNWMGIAKRIVITFKNVDYICIVFLLLWILTLIILYEEINGMDLNSTYSWPSVCRSVCPQILNNRISLERYGDYCEDIFVNLYLIHIEMFHTVTSEMYPILYKNYSLHQIAFDRT